jgi:quinol monooxygenase YgiN
MNPHNEIQTVWAYEVRSEFIDQFKAAYGPDGKWAKLFRHCSGYLKTVFLQDLDNPNRFVTIDYWRSYSAYSSMKEIVAPEYEYLDKQCEPYTASKDHLGIFETIDDWKNDA